MDKITLKLIKYFMTIITFIVLICFIASSIFLSKFYLNLQYNSLKASAEDVYALTSKNEVITDTSISAMLIKGGEITTLTQGKMGMMPFLRSIDESSLKTKGKIQNGMGTEFLYYKLQTDIGDIIVFQNNKFSSDYLTIVYIVLLSIFIAALLLSIPIISYMGKNFTKPILKLQKAASSIANGNFDTDCSVNTKDEIEALSNSLTMMVAKLKKKYQLQRDFIANVSHDFKTPLSVIRSCSEAVYDGILDEADTKKYSKEIIQEVDRLNNLVMDVLQLSKLQDGAYTLHEEFISLPQLVSECENMFKIICEKKNISFVSSIKSVEIYADKKYLQRVLYNFIDNAVKFSSSSGKVEVFSSEENSYLRLSIKDYGIGIEEALQDEIWDKYYKNSESGGMGLGLPICKEILKKHQFNYGVNSSLGSFCEFYFDIPKDKIRVKGER